MTVVRPVLKISEHTVPLHTSIRLRIFLEVKCLLILESFNICIRGVHGCSVTSVLSEHTVRPLGIPSDRHRGDHRVESQRKVFPALYHTLSGSSRLKFNSYKSNKEKFHSNYKF